MNNRASTAVMVLAASMLLAGGFALWQSHATASATSANPAGASPSGKIVAGEHVTVFDDIPAVTGLDDGLLAAVRDAATDAAADGIHLRVNSGWRTAQLQQQLLDDAVARYGSREEAARWVATPGTSSHVTGDAIDIGAADATAWLSRHGARYGLCQIYVNEPWHYELRPEAASAGCPVPYRDPTEDPRMNR